MKDTTYYSIEYDISFFVLNKKKVETYTKDKDFVALKKGDFDYIMNLIEHNINHNVDTNALPKIPFLYQKTTFLDLRATNNYWINVLNQLKNKKKISAKQLFSIEWQMFISKVSVFPYNTIDSDAFHLSFAFWVAMGDDIYDAFTTTYDNGSLLGCDNISEDFTKKNNFINLKKAYDMQFLQLSNCVCEKMKERCQAALNKGIESEGVKNEIYYFLDIIEKVLLGEYVLCFANPYI